MEQTYIMLKPDAYQRKLLGKIISRIEEKGFIISRMEMRTLDEKIIKEHYSHMLDKPFFPEILSFMTSGPVVAMIVEGNDVIQGMRKIMGVTNWLEAEPGTIRGDFANDVMFNLIHGSDSVETAQIEIKRFFE